MHRERKQRTLVWSLRVLGLVALLVGALLPGARVPVRWLLWVVALTALCLSFWWTRWIGHVPYTDFGEEEGNLRSWGRGHVDDLLGGKPGSRHDGEQ
jgi:hypothetical protein